MNKLEFKIDDFVVDEWKDTIWIVRELRETTCVLDNTIIRIERSYNGLSKYDPDEYRRLLYRRKHEEAARYAKERYI